MDPYNNNNQYCTNNHSDSYVNHIDGYNIPPPDIQSFNENTASLMDIANNNYSINPMVNCNSTAIPGNITRVNSVEYNNNNNNFSGQISINPASIPNNNHANYNLVNSNNNSVSRDIRQNSFDNSFFGNNDFGAQNNSHNNLSRDQLILIAVQLQNIVNQLINIIN